MKESFGNEYHGCALHKELENGKTCGRLILSPGWLRFESDQQIIEFPLNDLIIKRGGASGHLVFLEHPSQPGSLIYTEEKGILKKLKNYSSPSTPERNQIQSQVRKIKKTNFMIRVFILFSIIILVALIFGIYLLRNPITEGIAKKIPPDWEIGLGRTVFESYLAEKKTNEDKDILESFEKLTKPLLTTIPNKKYPFHFFIIEDSALNAFALPGGYVIINTGLIDAVQSAEELLGVLAHEIAHVTLKHGIRKLLDSLGLILILKALTGDQASLWTEVAAKATFLLNQKFSREFEKEADEMGFSYLLQAGIQPRGMIIFFQRLEQMNKQNRTMELEKKLNFLSTHPIPESRIGYLQEMWKQIDTNRKFLNLKNDFESFKSIRKKALSQNH